MVIPVELDAPLHSIGFEIDVLSPKEVTGYFHVTRACCQPFMVLHVGVPALIAEALASMGAYVACGFQRVAGVQLSVNHYQTAVFDDLVFARAEPVEIGQEVQIWKVCLWKMDKATMKEESLIASSTVTIRSNMNMPEPNTEAVLAFKNYAKL